LLRLHTFGSLAIHGPDGPMEGAAGQPRRLALLVLIARGGSRGVARAKLLDVLWPDAGEARGRRAIAQALYALRRDLGDEDAITGTQLLSLNDQVAWCDLIAFEQALEDGAHADAVSLYVGPFLDGFHVPDAPDFERWADDERTALAHRVEQALERLATEAAGRGDHNAASRWWRRRAALDPLNSRVAAAMMRALAASGDRPAAIRHSELFETLMAEELALPPDREVMALAAELRASVAGERAATRREARGQLVVAILPFAHTEPDAGLAAVLHDELMHRAISLSGVRVLARAASNSLGAMPTMSALRDAGATVAVEGSIRRIGGESRITSRLITVGDEHAVWGDRTSFTDESVSSVVDGVVMRIVGAIEKACG
jgi:DNA-binding SARP family transcriptional activator